jgi:transposase-like protein
MPRSEPRTVRPCSDEFEFAAVRLNQAPGIQVQTFAAALAIHSFMLSKWREDARDGRLRGAAPKAPAAMQLTLALVGLYLCVERGCTARRADPPPLMSGFRT